MPAAAEDLPQWLGEGWISQMFSGDGC